MKKSSIIVSSVLVGIALIGLIYWAGKNQIGTSSKQSVTLETSIGAQGSVVSLAVPEKSYDFGIISMKNGDVTKEFKITNQTNADVFVATLSTSCMCTSAFIVGSDGAIKGPFKMPGMGYVPRANEIIKAGESRIVRVVFDPNAHGPAGVGPINRQITLSDEKGETLQFDIKGVVKP